MDLQAPTATAPQPPTQGQDQQGMGVTQMACVKFYTQQTGRLPQLYKIQPGTATGTFFTPSSASAGGTGSEFGHLIFDSVDLKRTSIIEEVYRKGKVVSIPEDILRLRVMSLEHYPLPLEAVNSYKNVCYLDISSFVQDLSSVFHLACNLPVLGVLNFTHGSICDMASSSNTNQKGVADKELQTRASLHADSLAANRALMSVNVIIDADKFYKEDLRRQRNITERIYTVLKYIMKVCPNLARTDLAIPFEVDLTNFRKTLPRVSVKLVPFVANTATAAVTETSITVVTQSVQQQSQPGPQTAEAAATVPSAPEEPAPAAAPAPAPAAAPAPAPAAAPAPAVSAPAAGNPTRMKKPLRSSWESKRNPRPTKSASTSASSTYGTSNVVVLPKTLNCVNMNPGEKNPPNTPEVVTLDDSDESQDGRNVGVGRGGTGSHSKRRRSER